MNRNEQLGGQINPHEQTDPLLNLLATIQYIGGIILLQVESEPTWDVLGAQA